MKLLDAFLYFVGLIVKVIDLVSKARAKKKVSDAFNEAEKKDSQEPIEKVLSGSSGRPTKYKYNGLSTQDRTRDPPRD